MDEDLYWAYNLPLQIRTIYEDQEDESSSAVGYKVLNYMPRKEKVVWLNLEDTYLGVDKDRYLVLAAEKLRDLALQMEEAVGNDKPYIYYP